VRVYEHTNALPPTGIGKKSADATHTWSGQELPIWMAQECPAAVNAETKFWRARASAPAFVMNYLREQVNTIAHARDERRR